MTTTSPDPNVVQCKHEWKQVENPTGKKEDGLLLVCKKCPETRRVKSPKETQTEGKHTIMG